jgi:ribosome-binding factor A
MAISAKGINARLTRNDVIVSKTIIASLRRFKDDVAEVRAGLECGAVLQDTNDIKAGDMLELFEVEERARVLVTPGEGECDMAGMRALPSACLRVGEQVRHVLADILQRGDVHDDTLASHMVSVTEVRMTPDLRHAIAYVKPLLGKDEEAVLKALRTNTAYLQREVARRVKMRNAAKLKFIIDESFDEGSAYRGAAARSQGGAGSGRGMNALEAVLEDGGLSLVPFRIEHTGALREACARDPAIWEIYPVNMLEGDAEAMLKRFHGEQGWVRFSVLVEWGGCRHDKLYQPRPRQRHGDDRRHLYRAIGARHRRQPSDEKADDRSCHCLRLLADRVHGRYAESALDGGDGEARRGARRDFAQKPCDLDRLCPRHRAVCDPRRRLASDPRMKPLHGWIILDKPYGLGSTQAVAAVKRCLREAGRRRPRSATAARSIRLPRACCRLRWAKRPSSPGGCWTATRPTISRSNLEPRPIRWMWKGRWSRPAMCGLRADMEAVLLALHRPHRADAARL